MATPETNEAPWQSNLFEVFGFKPQPEGPMQASVSLGKAPWESPESLWGMYKQKPPVEAPMASKGAGKGTSPGVEGVFAKLIQAESRGRHRDSSGKLTTSPAGAQGITQVLPDTGRDPGYGVAPLKDDSESEYIRFGKDLLNAYTKELGGDIRKGLAAYNHGIGAVQKKIAQYGDDWEKKLPSETKKYLTNILGAATGSGNAHAGSLPQQPDLGYGKRPDGSQKGNGFLGPLKAKDGSVMTEFSVGVNIGGQEMDIPTFVPTLTKAELDELLSGKDPSDAVVQKAVDHAKMRIGKGLSPFSQQGEKNSES